jgi:hypothetical protein
MARTLILLSVVIVFLSSCSGNTTIGPSGADTLLARFEKINPDDLHIYSPCDTTDGNMTIILQIIWQIPVTMFLAAINLN